MRPIELRLALLYRFQEALFFLELAIEMDLVGVVEKIIS
jgi:hypothetical protein